MMLIISVVCVVACAGMLAIALRAPAASTASGRLAAAVGQGSGLVMPGSELDDYLQGSTLRRWGARRLSDFHGWLEQIAPPHILERAQLTMERLGYATKRSAGAYLLIKTVLSVLAIVLVVWALAFYPAPLTHRLLLSGLVSIVTVLGPSVMLRGQIRARQDEIRYSLPDVIDLLAVSAEAGNGLDGAIAAVIARKPGPLTDELNRMLLEMRLGESRDEAWERLLDRVDLPELRSFVAALQDAEEMGVSIANTLRVQSDGLRAKRSLLVRQLAATLPIKMLFPLIFCILPSLFAVLLGPGMISIYAAMNQVMPK